MSDRVLHEIHKKPGGGWEVTRPYSARLRDLITERADGVQVRTIFPNLDPGPIAMLHFVPQGSLDDAVAVDLKDLANNCQELRPLATGGWNERYNADGLLVEAPSANGNIEGYAQLFRNGIVETATTAFFQEHGGRVVLASLLFEQEIISAVERCLALATRLGAVPPHVACVALAGVKGVSFAGNSFRYWSSQGRQIDRDKVQAPPVVIDGQADIAKALRPTFDYLWQAAGWAESHYYDKDGNRRQ